MDNEYPILNSGLGADNVHKTKAIFGNQILYISGARETVYQKATCMTILGCNQAYRSSHLADEISPRMMQERSFHGHFEGTFRWAQRRKEELQRVDIFHRDRMSWVRNRRGTKDRISRRA